MAEQLASKMSGGASASRSFDNVIARRVFGGRGSDAIARSVRGEISRMFHARPICKCVYACMQIRVVAFCTRSSTVLL